MKYNWLEIERHYVQGREVDGRIEHPSHAALAAEFGVSLFYLQKKSAEGAWSKNRQKFLDEFKTKAIAEAATSLAQRSSKFDLACLSAAEKLVDYLARRIERAERQGQTMTITLAKDMAHTLRNAQAAGRLALGKNAEIPPELPRGVFRIVNARREEEGGEI
jgi:hypothetical protein